MFVLLCLAAQETREEKGKYALSFFGRPAGSEEYRLEEFEDGQIVLHARAKFEIQSQGRAVPVSVDAMLTMNKAFAPVRYAGIEEAGSQTRRSKIEWRDGSAWHEPRKGVRTTAAFLLDNNAFSQFIPILRRFEGPGMKVKVFSPATLGDVEVAIEDKGEVTLRGKDSALRAREIRLTIGASAITAHRDAKGRIVRLANPLVGALAELQGFEGYAPEPRGGEIRRPESVVEFDVAFPSGPVTLAGSLTTARGTKGAPAVVILSGSGPQDRDGNAVRGKGDWDPSAWRGSGLYRSIAYALSEAGLTVLRTDDRGCGKSGGDFAAAKLSDLTADAEAAVAYLRSRGDTGAIGLAGHSEGAVIAPIVASRDEGIRACFLLAGPARPLDQVFLEQIAARLAESGMKEEAVAAVVSGERAVFDRIRTSREDFLEIDERKTFVGWMREHFRHDPLAQIGKVKGPIVILHGMADRQVRPEHAELLAKARRDAELRRFDALDHFFMKSEGKASESADPDRRADGEFLKFLSDRAVKLLR